jgi:hypothetical protein
MPRAPSLSRIARHFLAKGDELAARLRSVVTTRVDVTKVAAAAIVKNAPLMAQKREEICVMANYFHFGVLVSDLNAAIAEFGARLRVNFTKPTIAHCANFLDVGGNRRVLDLKVAYSMTSEPYYELLEVQQQGLYGPANGLGFHHVGVWEENCEARVSELVGRGMELEAAQYDPQGKIIVAYLSPRGLAGIRYELVNANRRQMMEAWVSGGEFVDYV